MVFRNMVQKQIRLPIHVARLPTRIRKNAADETRSAEEHAAIAAPQIVHLVARIRYCDFSTDGMI